jgi:hypothetical protein
MSDFNLSDPDRHHREQRLLEILETLTSLVERTTRRMDQEARDDRETLGKILHELGVIARGLQPPPPPPSNQFTITITETSMALGQLTSPGTAALLLALLDNGSPYVAPADSNYTFSPSLTASDPSVAIAADPSTPDEFDVSIPAGDAGTSVVFTATATAPDGSTATGTLTIPLEPEPQQFTISVTQTA